MKRIVCAACALALFLACAACAQEGVAGERNEWIRALDAALGSRMKAREAYDAGMCRVCPVTGLKKGEALAVETDGAKALLVRGAYYDMRASSDKEDVPALVAAFVESLGADGAKEIAGALLAKGPADGLGPLLSGEDRGEEAGSLVLSFRASREILAVVAWERAGG